MKQENIQQIIDRISYTVESQFLDSAGNLKAISEYKNKGKEYLFLYFSTVTMDTLNGINQELGTRINTIFPDTQYGIEVIVNLEQVMLR